MNQSSVRVAVIALACGVGVTRPAAARSLSPSRRVTPAALPDLSGPRLENGAGGAARRLSTRVGVQEQFLGLRTAKPSAVAYDSLVDDTVPIPASTR